ncbi:MAG: hypothetical protein J7L14_02355 [Candidatus Diapherotrites archaeon]|nr:hypothetical protein [Candidatus Diapherotrites archaeon]
MPAFAPTPSSAGFPWTKVLAGLLAVLLGGGLGYALTASSVSKVEESTAADIEDLRSQIEELAQKNEELVRQINQLQRQIEEQAEDNEQMEQLMQSILDMTEAIKENRETLQQLYALIAVMANSSADTNSDWISAWLQLEMQRMQMDYQILSALLDILQEANQKPIMVDVNVLNQLQQQIKQIQRIVQGNQTWTNTTNP